MQSAFEVANKILSDIEAENPSNEQELEIFRIKYLGTKNILKPLFEELKNLPNDQKKSYGQLMNTLKQTAETKFEAHKNSVDNQVEKNSLDIDLTAPGYPTTLGSLHPITLTMNKIVSIFEKIGFEVAEDREIEDDWHNFSAMNTPEDHPARDMQDTYYLLHNPQYLLRTHTSSVQARVMTTQKPPIRIIAPGRVYRNETISARSHCQFHQVEGLFVDKDVSFADLKQTLSYFAQQMFGSSKIRLRPSYFPFTEPSAEMDVYLGTDTPQTHRLTKGTGWLEILGCGMVDPQVLENCGIDSTVYSGFAFGMGVERQAMRLYNIPDIRMLFENDIRFLRQFSALG